VFRARRPASRQLADLSEQAGGPGPEAASPAQR
jgi:hypothetical protein